MSHDVIDLNFIAKLLQRTNEEVRGLRKDVADIRTLTLQTYDFSCRLERREIELKDDLEVMVKMELTGALAHLQSKLEGTLGRIEDKMDGLVDRVADLESRPI
ncbi:hypothetical protein GAO09_01160 [Rhizobiales bacterium RZME27]|uniref:Uncharacterized protein n=1 Tax=Endobacterium cereale TaxID=2663029 RepID=A0A6A8A776_9HYPH|nr:hypothetical protein [Endobacterium cereale]MEB2844764.1 hypothetical protein [Endobacterium cereale]MQY44681.1 hypothetical protein [Endobacterium cereale]